MSVKTNAFTTKRLKFLLTVLMSFTFCVLTFIAGPVEAVSGGLAAVGILVLMITDSKIGVIIVGSLTVGSGSFLIGHMAGRFLG